MEKYGMLLQVLAGIIFGFDYVLPRTWLDKLNSTFSRILSYLSGKPSRARKVSLVVALSLASLAVALPMIIINYKEAAASPWEIIVGGIFFVALGGFAYLYLLEFIIKRVSKSHIFEKEPKPFTNDRNLLLANALLLIIATAWFGILSLIAYVFKDSISPITYIVAMLFAIFVLFLFPAFIGSLFYLIIRVFVILLDKLGKMPRGALGPIALGLFVLGGIFLLIEAW